MVVAVVRLLERRLLAGAAVRPPRPREIPGHRRQFPVPLPNGPFWSAPTAVALVVPFLEHVGYGPSTKVRPPGLVLPLALLLRLVNNEGHRVVLEPEVRRNPFLLPRA